MSHPLAGPGASLTSNQLSASEPPADNHFGEVLVSAACGLEEAQPPVAEPPVRQPSRAVPTSNTSKHRKSKPSSLEKPHQKGSGLLGFVRSQRVRKLVTMACVLVVVGLIVINVKNRRSNERVNAEFEAIELTDFGSDFGTGEKSTGDESTLSTASDWTTESLERTDSSIVPAGAWSKPSLASDQGLDSNATDSGTNRSGIPNSSSNGIRGAWLTGHIEPDADDVVPAKVSRSSASQRSVQVSPVAGESRLR